MTMLQDLAALVYEFNKADRRKPGFGGEAADMARRFVCQTAKIDRADTRGTIEAKLAAALAEPPAANPGQRTFLMSLAEEGRRILAVTPAESHVLFLPTPDLARGNIRIRVVVVDLRNGDTWSAVAAM